MFWLKSDVTLVKTSKYIITNERRRGEGERETTKETVRGIRANKRNSARVMSGEAVKFVACVPSRDLYSPLHPLFRR